MPLARGNNPLVAGIHKYELQRINYIEAIKDNVNQKNVELFLFGVLYS